MKYKIAVSNLDDKQGGADRLNWTRNTFGPRDVKWELNHTIEHHNIYSFEEEPDLLLFVLKWGGTILPETT